MLRKRLELEQLGPRVQVEAGRFSGLSWLAEDGYFEDVVEINLANVRNFDLDNILCFAQLRSLVLYQYPITDEDLEKLTRLTHLRELNLFKTPIKGPGIRHLASLPRLEELRIGPISDESVPQLAMLQQLRVLRVLGTVEFTDQGLSMLAALPRLETLHLVDCPGTTKAGTQKLLEARPGLEIVPPP
jgi:hypothetical protein